MKLEGEQVLLRVYLRNTDKKGWFSPPAAADLVQRAKSSGLAGATVLRGFFGLDANGHLLESSRWSLVEHVPIIVEFVDGPQIIGRFLSVVGEVVEEGLATLERAHVLMYRQSQKELDKAHRHLAVPGSIKPLSTLPSPEEFPAMQLSETGQLLRVFIGDSDLWQGEPLYRAIVLKARELGLAGATVLRGPMGFGAQSRIHTTTFLALSTDLPILIEIVDTSDKIEKPPPLPRRGGDGWHDYDRGCPGSQVSARRAEDAPLTAGMLRRGDCGPSGYGQRTNGVMPDFLETGSWHTLPRSRLMEAGPSTIGDFSAVAYYFGRDLQKALDVPVGIIHTSWGGTASEEWTSMKVLNAHPEHKGQHPRQSKLYNGMIAPLIPYAIKGAIWYQGESNAGRAELYKTGFPLMIQNWRDDWKQGDFPFLFVQLAPYMKIEKEPTDPAWAHLREAQLQTTVRSKHTAMAVITDVGDEKDIHPKRKEPVGHRLALAAEALAYGKKIEYSGPVFDKLTVEGNKAVLTFTHLAGGLEAKDGPLTGFTIAGEDKVFHNAKAEIKGDTVVVFCKDVEKPVAVRFGWANYPVVNLWNKAGLPASPFRTDDFPMITKTK